MRHTGYCMGIPRWEAAIWVYQAADQSATYVQLRAATRPPIRSFSSYWRPHAACEGKQNGAEEALGSVVMFNHRELFLRQSPCLSRQCVDLTTYPCIKSSATSSCSLVVAEWIWFKSHQSSITLAFFFASYLKSSWRIKVSTTKAGKHEASDTWGMKSLHPCLLRKLQPPLCQSRLPREGQEGGLVLLLLSH